MSVQCVERPTLRRSVTVATVVVLIDLLRTPTNELDIGDALKKNEEVNKALEKMKQIAHVSHSARGSVRVIEQLLSELEEKRSGKVPSPVDTESVHSAANGLHRAVKKLITDQNNASNSSNNSAPTWSSGRSVTSDTDKNENPNARNNAEGGGAFANEHANNNGGGNGGAVPGMNGPPAYGQFANLFDWDANASAAGFGSFPMEVSGATTMGMGAHMPVNFDNIELENMLASFMPSRAPSPVAGNRTEFTSRLANYNGEASEPSPVWPQGGRGDFSNPAAGNPYTGWMG